MVVVSIKTRTGSAVTTIIFGAHGMLGHDLTVVFPDAVAKGHELDITRQKNVTSFLQRVRPDVVINAAAYTDVEGCEDHPDTAFAVNGRACEYLARGCAATGAMLVHYSTDYVFDGTRKEYREDDAPNPGNVYGRSKLLGETLIRDHMDNYRIIRTSWLFGKNGKNFVTTMLELSTRMAEVPVVADQFGKPTYTVDLARKTGDIIASRPGVYHITNEGACSWYDLAKAVIPNAVPCTSGEFPRKAKRPQYSILANTKTGPLRHWKDALREYMDLLAREGAA